MQNKQLKQTSMLKFEASSKPDEFEDCSKPADDEDCSKPADHEQKTSEGVSFITNLGAPSRSSLASLHVHARVSPEFSPLLNVSATSLAGAGKGRTPTPEEDGVLIAWFARIWDWLDEEPEHETFIKQLLANHRHWFEAYARALEKLNPKPSKARFTYLARQLVNDGFTSPEQRILIGRAGTPARQQLIAKALKVGGVHCTVTFHDILFTDEGNGFITADYIIACGEKNVRFDLMLEVDSLFGLPGTSQEVNAAWKVCDHIYYLQSNKMSKGLISEVSTRPDLGVANVDYTLEGSTLVKINPLNVDDDSYFMEECGELKDGLQPSVLSPPVYVYITSLQRNLANDRSKYAGQTIQFGGPPARYPWKHPVKVVQTVATVEANVGQSGRRVLANLAETQVFNALGVNQKDWKNVHCVVGASPLGGGSDFSQSQRRAGGKLSNGGKATVKSHGNQMANGGKAGLGSMEEKRRNPVDNRKRARSVKQARRRSDSQKDGICNKCGRLGKKAPAGSRQAKAHMVHCGMRVKAGEKCDGCGAIGKSLQHNKLCGYYL